MKFYEMDLRTILQLWLKRIGKFKKKPQNQITVLKKTEAVLHSYASLRDQVFAGNNPKWG